MASVIGREFTVRMLERVLGLSQSLKQTLGQLRAIELIYEKTLYPELEYMFGHALTHDVAYQSLIKQRQKELHRKVGEVMETLYADLLPEFYETLAWHFQREGRELDQDSLLFGDVGQKAQKKVRLSTSATAMRVSS